MKESKNAFDTDKPLHTFSIGIAGSPDLAAARKVADFLGTTHHEFTFTVEEGLDALYDLIWHIESYEQVGGVALFIEPSQQSRGLVASSFFVPFECLREVALPNVDVKTRLQAYVLDKV